MQRSVAPSDADLAVSSAAACGGSRVEHRRIDPPLPADIDDGSTVRKLRVWKRHAVSVAAHLVSDGLSVPVRISDVSVMGLGFFGQTGFADWTVLEIHLPDGRRLRGTLIWAHNGRGGIELAEPLCADDPVFGRLDDTPSGGLRYERVRAPGTAPGLIDLLRTLWQRLRRQARRGEASPQASERMIARACRKQGFAWLAEEEGLSRSSSDDSNDEHGSSRDG